MSWIANAESGSSVRGKLNALMVPISSMSISSPAEYLDIALPSGYDRFVIHHDGVKLSVTDSFAAAFSADGGTNFYCDASNFDTYGQLYDYLNLSQSNTFARQAGGSKSDNSTINSGINDFPAQSTNGAIQGTASIFPGSASRAPAMEWGLFFHATDTVGDLGSAIIDYYRFHAFLNPSATVTPTLARLNLIRFLPYGNGDCDPPTSGETITSGTFHLFGIPSA